MKTYCSMGPWPVNLHGPAAANRHGPGAHATTRHHRGVALLVVLSIISVSLAITYAVMRRQAVMLQVQQNTLTRLSARHTAMTGLSIALRKMHQNDWAGVGTALSGSLAPDAGYLVTFTTGDPVLEDSSNLGQADPAHPDYRDWPFRVTVESVGKVRVSDNGAAPAEHRVRAVMRLVPRALSAEPTAWDEVNAYTVYQSSAVDSFVHAPAQILGPMRLRSALQICPGFSWSDATRDRYLGDLVAMYQAGLGDNRLLTGWVELPFDQQSSSDLVLLQTTMGVTTLDTNSMTMTGWDFPEVTTYQLYPGGKIYNVASCSATLIGTSLGPNPDTNPAGLFFRSGNVDLEGDVTVIGTIMNLGKLRLRGPNMDVRPVDLPPLDGTTEAVQLPLFVTADDFEVRQNCVATAQGMIVAWDRFDIQGTADSDAFNLTGRAICRELRIERRNSWDFTSADWDSLHASFDAAVALGTATHFPAYLTEQGYSHVPTVTLQAPEDNQVRYHWLTNGGTIYAPAPGDAGLMWDLLDWKDGS